MATLGFQDARETVLREVRAAAGTPVREDVALEDACGRVLAEDIAADRDMPALARSTRDGYAVRAADVPGTLEVIGEARAGGSFTGAVGQGQAVEIMTGAPLVPGADAVVMVEHTRREGSRVTVERAAPPGQFITPRASEAAAGERVLEAGRRLDYRGVALLAATGRVRVAVVRKPVVAIVPTGDEIVEVSAMPRDFEIRNSNAWSLAAQVARAGGAPRILGVARDSEAATRALIERGLEADLLLLSGGVSAGRYDLVESALAALGARFYFDRVLVQPGRPLVFGRVRGKFFFGLPGNPASTMVTFEVFARAAVELLGGELSPALRMPLARLAAPFRHQTGLTRFLPARVSDDGAEVTPMPWHGSSDIPALARANAYLVAAADRAEWARGDLIPVLLQ